MSSYLDTLPRWPAGKPLPVGAITLFQDTLTRLEYRIDPVYFGGTGTGAGGRYVALSLTEARALRLSNPPSVMPTALYGITGDWNGAADSLVYVGGVTPTEYHTLGVVYDDQGVGQLVEVDVVAGTYKKLSGGEDLLSSNNIWTGVNTYETDFKLGRPYSSSSTSIQWYPNGIGFYDVDNGIYSTVDAANYSAYNALPAYTSYVDFADAFQELATTTGSRIQWVQGGLTDYGTYGGKRGSITRPHATAELAQEAAREGDVICVLPGGTGVDALGRVCYMDSFTQTKKVRLILMPGVVWAGTLAFGGYGADKPFNYVVEGIGAICLGLVGLCRQASAKSTLTVRNIRLEGLGTFQYIANNDLVSNHVDDFIIEDCHVDSKRTGGTEGPIRNNSRLEYGQCRMIVRNTPVYTLDAPCITFSAFKPGSVVLEGALTQMYPGGGRAAYESKNTDQGAPTTPEADWLVDNRPSGGAPGGGTVKSVNGVGPDGNGNVQIATGGSSTATYFSGTYTAPAGGQQTITATDLSGLAQATKIVSVGVRGVTVGGDPTLDFLPERDANGQLVYSFDLTSHTLTVLPSAGLDGGNVLEIAWLTGGLAAGYTDAQARAAQLGRTAAAGTTTVTLTAEAPTDYGTIASGSFTVNATGCVVGKCVRFAVGAGAGAPVFNNAPSGQPYKYLGATYASGKAFSYSLLVCVDRIEVIILAE